MRIFIFLAALFLAACGDSGSDSNTTAPAPEAAQSPVQATTPRPAPAAFATLKNCIACHNATGNMVGPSWHNIAEKYKTDPTAAARLTQKVLTGGSGSFGAVMMPPQSSKITPDEAQFMVEWILKGAPN